MTRHTIRKHIFTMLFRVEFHDSSEISSQDGLYLDTIDNITDEEREYMEKRVSAIVELLPEIDKKLESVSEGWKLERMGKVELTILRLAVYELLYDDDIPANVAINEAVELAKVYGGDTSPAFVNGILAKLL
ncbi:MAG: transcription antitermination factor NusB [Clostridia bacterium]|nr:transcription antitermination factor NusB [[Bacteroides] pectinophilus]MDD5874119.1 transcription antitermination factor NusB [Clostridia bacterium]